MIIDLDIFEHKGNKQEKIRILEIIGVNVNPVMRQKIMYEDMILKAYKCSQGVWTIGVGCTAYEDSSKVKEGDVINIIRSLTLFHHHHSKAVQNLRCIFKFKELNEMGEVRKNVLVDLIFNMGLSGVKGFPSMIRALKNQDWDRASKELKYADVEKEILSKYYQQVGQRAKDNVRKLKEG